MSDYKNTKIYNTESAFETFELIKKYPERYLSTDIYALQNFINGYLFGNPYPKDDPPFWDFHNYLLNETGFKPSEKWNLISIILLTECNQDAQKAYNRFFEYLEIYKK